MRRRVAMTTDLVKPMTKRFYFSVLAVFLLFLVGGPWNATAQTEQYFQPVPDSLYEGLAFDMPTVEVPTFPDYSVSIKAYGAEGDGETLNTEAFEKAIAHVSERGGGRVVVPKGIWRTGPIVLQSNVNLHAKQGALVVFSDNFDLYPLIETSFEGLDTYRSMSPIYAKGVENVAITGEGVFDGSGGAWRPVHRKEMTERQWEEKVASGGVVTETEGETTWYPSKESMQGDPGNFNVPPDRTTREDYMEVKDFLRPVMISIRESENVLLDGPTFQNSPAWMLHPLMSENLVIRNLKIRNPVYAMNGDGLDLESSKNVVMYGNSFDVGDDAICIKSGKNEDGRERGMPTENVIIRDNTVYRAHGGFVVGSEMSGGVRNIAVSDMTFIGTDVGVRFKSTRGRGGVVENIYISDIDMLDIVTEPIRFNLYYDGEAPSPNQKSEVVDEKKVEEQIPEVTVETPQFRNIFLENILCQGAETALWIQGLPEMNVQNVQLENVRVTARRGGMVTDTDGLHLNDVTLTLQEGPGLYLSNAHNVQLRQSEIAFRDAPGVGVRLEGPFTEKIALEGMRFTNTETDVSRGPNVEPSRVSRSEEGGQ